MALLRITPPRVTDRARPAHLSLAMTARVALGCALGALSAWAPQGRAEVVPFVVAEDLGIIEDTPFDSNVNANRIVNAVLDLYDSTGADMPEVMSVWTAFPFNGNTVETRFVPVKNDVSGIGFEHTFGAGGELFDQLPPLRAMLIHNDVTALAERAAVQRTPLDGFGEYLFLLELSHLWGPEIRVPAENGPADRLLGFPFHWSFFVDFVSPAGGNPWVDNGDGTFTTPVFHAPSVTFSPLDLYLMGLLPASEVPPFGLLREVVAPADAIDPFTRRTVTKASFPWQGPEPLTVTATRETLTIDDVIAANGPRTPPFGEAPTSMTLGILLIVPANIGLAERESVMRDFVPLAEALAPSFSRASGARASLEVITASEGPPPLPQTPPPPGDPDDSGPSSDGCAASGTAASGTAAREGGARPIVALLALLLVASCRTPWRRRRAPPSELSLVDEV
jgi:large repetitive protein